MVYVCLEMLMKLKDWSQWSLCFNLVEPSTRWTMQCYTVTSVKEALDWFWYFWRSVLHWFASYLEERELSVLVSWQRLVHSQPPSVWCPQGSVLGPILFTLYSQSQPLSDSDLICSHECDYLKYADDTQLSKGAPPDQFQSLLFDIQTYILKISYKLDVQ